MRNKIDLLIELLEKSPGKNGDKPITWLDVIRTIMTAIILLDCYMS